MRKKVRSKKNIRNNTKKSRKNKLGIQKGGVEITSLFFSINSLIGQVFIGGTVIENLLGIIKSDEFSNKPSLINVVDCHGCLVAGDVVEIPEGINILTMVSHGNYVFGGEEMYSLMFNLLLAVNYDINKMFNIEKYGGLDKMKGERLTSIDYTDIMKDYVYQMNLVLHKIFVQKKKTEEHNMVKNIDYLDFELRIGGKNIDDDIQICNNSLLQFFDNNISNMKKMFQKYSRMYGIIEPYNYYHNQFIKHFYKINPLKELKHKIFKPSPVTKFVPEATNGKTDLRKLINSMEIKKEEVELY